jgi:hypothetical protein
MLDLFFHVGLKSMDFPKSRDLLQPWVLYTDTSPIEHPVPHNNLKPEIIRLFDKTMSYRLDSDFPIPFIDKNIITAALAKLSDENLIHRFTGLSIREKAPVVWYSQGACYSWNDRYRIMRALEGHGIAVDIIHVETAEDQSFETSSMAYCTPKLGTVISAASVDKVPELMKDYMFSLVLETSNCHDYVTTGFQYAMQSGTIPIVDGPGSYEKFVPHPDAVIYLFDESDLKQKQELVMDHILNRLVERVHRLIQNQESYFQFVKTARDTPPNPEWLARWSQFSDYQHQRTGWCGLCQFALESEAALKGHRLSTENSLRLHQTRSDRIEKELKYLEKVRQELSLRNNTRELMRDLLPLPINAPAPVPPQFNLLSPDYSCSLAKWAELPVVHGTDAPPAPTIENFRNSFPKEYLKHAILGVQSETLYVKRIPRSWPEPLHRIPPSLSLQADLAQFVSDENKSPWISPSLPENQYWEYDIFDMALASVAILCLLSALYTARNRTSTKYQRLPPIRPDSSIVRFHGHVD